MVSEGLGSIFKRKDGKYFIHLPKNLVKDTGFPFPITLSAKVKIRFTPGDNKVIIEEH